MAQQDRHPGIVAEEYVERFKQGIEPKRPSEGLFSGGEPDERALEVLGAHLGMEEAQVREWIVDLLVDMSTQSLALRKSGVEAITHPSVIRLLTGPGFAQPDIARERAMALLRKHCTRSALEPERARIAKALQAEPSKDALLLVAKAKAVEARPELEKLGVQDDWKDDHSWLIAWAALGDTMEANRYLGSLEEANAEADPAKFKSSINDLSLIGTDQTLRAVAESMRTPLILDVVGSYEKTMRLEVLEGLCYNYPDQPMLYPNYIITEDDFREAEEFCERTLGAVYQGAPPPFMTYRGHPEPMPGEK